MKYIKYLVIILILLVIPINLQKVNAQTLQEAMNELEKLKKDASNNRATKERSQAEILQLQQQVTKLYQEIDQAKADIERMTKEIEELTEDINKTDAETKSIVSYLQLSNGESAYLEYAFGAETITDFIYRVAIVEQISKYNSDAIESMNKKIIKNKEMQEELAQKQVEMNKKIEVSTERQLELNQYTKELDESYTTIESDIQKKEDLINYAKKKGCELGDELATCTGQLPYNTKFIRPVSYGYITSNFGPRNLSVASSSFHYGVDIGIGAGTSVYAPADGIVTGVEWNNCAGNTLYIVHNIGGSYYTTYYAHLSKINVSVGQTVYTNTVVAYSGNTGSCTTGAHLHFTITRKARYVTAGMYGIPANQVYYTYADLTRNAIDPKSMVSFPGLGGYFSGR